MTIVGTLKSADTLYTHGQGIKVMRANKSLIGKRVEVDGVLCYHKDTGAYLNITKQTPTIMRDSNYVEIEGEVLGVIRPRASQRHGQTACLIMRHNRRPSSKFMVTVPEARFDALDLDGVVAGQFLRIAGFLCYHSKGLHILFLRKEVNNDE